MIDFVNAFFWVIVIYLSFVGYVLFVKGADLRRLRVQDKSSFRSVIIEEHQYLAKMFLGGVVLLIIIAEFKVRLSAPSDRNWLFYIHLTLAIPGFIMLLLTHFRFNGLKVYPYKHRRMARWTLVLILGALATGILLFRNM